jgi:hypothetical protein
MRTEKFQLLGNNSVCAGTFQLLRGRAPAQLRRNVAGTHLRGAVLNICNFILHGLIVFKNRTVGKVFEILSENLRERNQL